MTLEEIVGKLNSLDEELVIFVKRHDGNYSGLSEAVLLVLSEEEQEMKTFEIAAQKCPGFEYFLEVFIAKEVVEDLTESNNSEVLSKKIERIIHYAEYDA